MTRRRLLIGCLLLLAGGLGWWLLRSGTDSEAIDALQDRDGHGAEAPVLRGAFNPPRPAPRAAGDPWELTYEVVGPSGTPVPGARVEVRNAQGRVVYDSQSRREGAPKTIQLRGGGNLVVRSHPYVPWVSPFFEPPTSGAHHLVVRLEKGRAVSGRVLAQDGRTPVEVGTVIASFDADGHAFGWARDLQADGRFHVSGLPPGSVTLSARPHDRRAGAPTRIEVAAGDEEVRLVLDPHGSISFFVADASDGHSLQTEELRIAIVEAGVEVPWLWWTGALLREHPVEAPVGLFSAHLGGSYRFRVSALGYEPSDCSCVVAKETGAAQIVRVPLRRAADYRARLAVRLRTEEAALPAWVLVTNRWGALGSDTVGWVEKEAFTIELLPGRHRLGIGGALRPKPSDEQNDGFWVPVDLDLEIGRDEHREIEVELQRGGWVRFLRALPHDTDVVTCRQGHTVTEREVRTLGRARGLAHLIGPLAPGPWILEYATENGRFRASVDVEVESEEETPFDPAAFAPVK